MIFSAHSFGISGCAKLTAYLRQPHFFLPIFTFHISLPAVNVKAKFKWLKGREGVEMILATSPNIVVTDIRMPFVDGIGMLEQTHNNDGVQDRHNGIFSGTFSYGDFASVYRSYTPDASIVPEYGPHVPLTCEGLRAHIDYVRRTFG